MVQDQLVEYINSQLKAGVSADSIKAALLGAGWQAADVDDTMKSVQGAKSPAAASPVASSAAATGAVAAARPQSGPQVIRVSDLVSNSPASSAAASPSTAKPASFSASASSSSSPSSSSMPSSFSPSMMTGAKTDAVISKIAAGRPAAATGVGASATVSASPAASSMNVAAARTGKSRALATESILGILMVIFGALAVFFYFENQSLSSQIAAANGSANGASSQVSSLQQQLTASTTALEAQVASANAQSSQLALELSFYVVPPSMSPATTTFTSALTGTVSGGGKYLYVITTSDGVKVSVSNSKDPNVVNLLKPLVGVTTSTTQFAGNYLPGQASIALTAVGGQSVTPPPAAPTSTATSSATSSGANAPMIPATSSANGH